MEVWQAALLDVVAAGQESYIFLQHCCFFGWLVVEIIFYQARS